MYFFDTFAKTNDLLYEKKPKTTVPVPGGDLFHGACRRLLCNKLSIKFL